MYFDISSWQKIGPGLYDSGSAIVAIRPKFLTSSIAMFFGAMTFVAGIIYAVPFVDNLLTPEIIWPLILIVPGVYIVIKGYQGTQLRKENGGVHPTDTVLTLDRGNNALRRRIGDIEEHLATFDQVQLEVYVDRSGKNTSYRIRLIWPNGKENIASKHSKKDAETLLADLRQRLGFPPEPTPTQP